MKVKSWHHTNSCFSIKLMSLLENKKWAWRNVSWDT